jgi:hypothetical protein
LRSGGPVLLSGRPLRLILLIIHQIELSLIGTFLLLSPIAIDSWIARASLHLIVEPRHFQEEIHKNYSVSVPAPVLFEKVDQKRCQTKKVVGAKIATLTEIKEAYPDLVTGVDLNDYSRLRYVVSLQNVHGDIIRVRLVQWNDRCLDGWRKLGKKPNPELVEGIFEALMFSVENMTPSEVENAFGA